MPRRLTSTVAGLTPAVLSLALLVSAPAHAAASAQPVDAPMSSAAHATSALVTIPPHRSERPAASPNGAGADGEPLPGYPVTVDGLDIAFHTTQADTDPLELANGAFNRPVPLLGFSVTNTSDRSRSVGLATDLAAAGELEPLWDAATWGGESAAHGQLHDAFRVQLAPGDTWPTAGGFLADGIAQWPGRTVAVFEIEQNSDAVAVPPGVGGTGTASTELAAVALPGRFVPVQVEDTRQEPAAVGAAVSIGGGAVEVFPGATASLTAPDLPAGEALEVWLAPAIDAFTVQLRGGALSDDAVQVGAGVVSSDGILRTSFTVPPTTTATEHTMLVGSAQDRYWPATLHDPLSVDAAAVTAYAIADAGPTEQQLRLGDAQVTVAYPDASSSGRTTAVLSGTGPAPFGFAPVDSPAAFVHLATTVDADDFTVCVPSTVTVPTASEESGARAPAASNETDPPQLYLHEPVGAHDDRWVALPAPPSDGPDAGTAGDARVCGQATTLGVFAVGHPVDDGSTEPPAHGVLSHDNDGPLADGDFTVTMDLHSGENARMVRLFENGKLVAHNSLELHSPDPQTARFVLTGRADGTFVYEAELENARGVTTTEPLTVTVTDADPAVPALSVAGPRGGSYVLSARTLWGTNASSYVFYEDGVPIAEGALVSASPQPQEATLTVTSQPAGTYRYTVEFRNAAGASTSSPLDVVVE